MVKYIFLVISAICCIDLSQFWLVVHTVVIHSTGIQFALVCPTEFWFFAQPFKSVATQNVQQPCTVAFGLQMAEIVTSIFRVKIQIQYNLTLLLQIYLEGRISKNFWISIYFWRFTSIRVWAGRWRVFNLFFNLYVFCHSCLSQYQKLTQKTHNNDKIKVKDIEVFHDFYFSLKMFQAQT